MKKVKENIRNKISFFLVIINLEIVFKEFLSLLDFSKTCIFDTYKLIVIVIIN